MRYVISKIAEHNQAVTYRFYVTDALKVIVENVHKIGGGSILKVRYSDLITHKEEKDDDRTAEDIITHIKTGLKKLENGDK